MPPNTGIVHQVNLEYLGRVIFDGEVDGKPRAYPDTLVGTDSHTTMINGLGVLGWGVGGIEAEAAMLGQPVTMLIPQVIGFRLNGKLKPGATATDLVLTVVEMLRKKGVVDKFVEFFGDGLANLPLADRATIANMAPEYGSTCGIFPIDEETIRYLELSGRPRERIDLVSRLREAPGHVAQQRRHSPPTTPTCWNWISARSSPASPARAVRRIACRCRTPSRSTRPTARRRPMSARRRMPSAKGVATATLDGKTFELKDGAVLIAAITSCTNTSNPSVMLGSGLLARKAVAKGLTSKPWVKTSLAPGSRVVTDYFEKAGVLGDLAALGFDVVGYGCTTCIGNSGPLKPEISAAVKAGDITACSVLSGNRNFEGRVHPEVKMNFLASPPLVVAYAIAGTLDIDLTREPLGTGKDGKPVMLADIWPSDQRSAGSADEVHRLRDVPEELRRRVQGR